VTMRIFCRMWPNKPFKHSRVRRWRVILRLHCTLVKIDWKVRLTRLVRKMNIFFCLCWSRDGLQARLAQVYIEFVATRRIKQKKDLQRQNCGGNTSKLFLPNWVKNVEKISQIVKNVGMFWPIWRDHPKCAFSFIRYVHTRHSSIWLTLH
jgi:hypothetical protein